MQVYLYMRLALPRRVERSLSLFIKLFIYLFRFFAPMIHGTYDEDTKPELEFDAE